MPVLTRFWHTITSGVLKGPGSSAFKAAERALPLGWSHWCPWREGAQLLLRIQV